MTLVTLPYRSELAGGQPEKIGFVLADFDAILAVVNGNIDNGNVAAGANIALSKLAISGTPNGSKYLRDDSTWAAAPGQAPVTVYKKVTAKDCTVQGALTDLFNGEITIAANVMGANGFMIIDCGGDFQCPTTNETIIVELKFGTAVLWNGGTSETITNSAPRRAWSLHAVIQNLNNTASQRGGGVFSLGSNNAAANGTGYMGAPNPDLGGIPFDCAPSAMNTTLAQPLTFSVNHSGSGNSMRLFRAIITVYNVP